MNRDSFPNRSSIDGENKRLKTSRCTPRACAHPCTIMQATNSLCMCMAGQERHPAVTKLRQGESHAMFIRVFRAALSQGRRHSRSVRRRRAYAGPGGCRRRHHRYQYDQHRHQLAPVYRPQWSRWRSEDRPDHRFNDAVAVPEPSGLAIVIFGLAEIGFLAFRRKPKFSAAAV
jgi:hypothetical protein